MAGADACVEAGGALLAAFWLCAQAVSPHKTNTIIVTEHSFTILLIPVSLRTIDVCRSWLR
jgi:hypothetical protein